MKYRWSLAPPQPALAGLLARTLGVSPLLAQCLLNRGLSEPDPIQRFLSPRLQQLADPFLLPHMEKAVRRLVHARQHRERLVIFGDYDVDGVTSTALLHEVLTALGWQVDYYLPHRLDEGYGLSREGVENCLARFNPTLLLAVDCGSTAVDTIGWLRQRRVEVIVLDHHQVLDPAPDAVALVNPQLAPPGAPSFRELCSAGLAFKLAHALVKHGRQIGLPGAGDYDVRPLLDLVALGTIADIVPVTRENRILVNTGLGWLNRTTRPGLVALKEVAHITGPVAGYEVGFQLGPRLNAAGRLENALQALQLLLARNLDEALPLARQLDAQNRERQAIERGIADEVVGAVSARFDPLTDYVVVEGQPSWHLGVVGIVASRVLQKFYRPTIILGGDGALWRGSGRSIEGFDLAAALRACGELLVRHGGHAMAAGVSIRPDRVEAFRTRLNDLARRSLSPELLQPTLRLDADVALRELDFERVRELDRLQQTGVGNPPVQVVARRLAHARPLQRIGTDRKHARLHVTDGRTAHQAMLWNAGDGPLPVGRFDLAFHPHLHAYQGSTSVRLKVLDWQAAT
ncbi:MAG: single-stranded-DNA-specific exonuclease RecJ [Verrucomicrobia bacterium]|nr:single-stranded-DNA-specific exonuclease RecJ [Verrucomicrobiota bacterium]